MESRLGRVTRRRILLALFAHAVPAFGGTMLPATAPGVSTAPLPVLFRRFRWPGSAPNILLVLAHDVGFGAASPLAALFRHPIRSGWHRTDRVTTASAPQPCVPPTRAALLTGRNHHAVGTGTLTDFTFGAAFSANHQHTGGTVRGAGQ